jgi:hypothetical protein
MTADGEGKIIASSSVAASDFQLRDGATMFEAVALVSVLNETVTQQQATISSLQGDITSMQTTIASMQATVATMQTAIAGKQNNLGLTHAVGYQTPNSGFWDNAWHRPNAYTTAVGLSSNSMTSEQHLHLRGHPNHTCTNRTTHHLTKGWSQVTVAAANVPLESISQQLVAFGDNAPDFAIVGAQKAGTTSLAAAIGCTQPRACMLRQPNFAGEFHLFANGRWPRRGGPLWPGPWPVGCDVRGFANPGVLVSAAIDANPLAVAAPKIKLVVLLREPIQRAFSAFSMYADDQRRGVVGMSRDRQLRHPFADFVSNQLRCEAGMACNRSSLDVISASLYAQQLRLLQAASFTRAPPANLYIGISERFASRRTVLAEYNAVFRFLGLLELSKLPPLARDSQRPGSYRESLSAPVVEALYNRFRASTTETYLMVGAVVTEWEDFYEEWDLP